MWSNNPTGALWRLEFEWFYPSAFVFPFLFTLVERELERERERARARGEKCPCGVL